MKLPHFLSRQKSESTSESDMGYSFVEVSNAQSEPMHPMFQEISDLIRKTPSASFLSSGMMEKGWWVKMKIDIGHNLAWQVVQEYAFVLNGISTTEKLPTVFKPKSAPPYLNGGPEDYLYWIIECPVNDFTPEIAKGWLETRLPTPIDDLAQWEHDES